MEYSTRCGTDRAPARDKSRNGCALYPIAHETYCRLSDGRFREEEIQKSKIGVDFRSVFPQAVLCARLVLTSIHSPRSGATSSAGTISNGARTDCRVSSYEYQLLSQRIARGNVSGSLELSGLVPPRLQPSDPGPFGRNCPEGEMSLIAVDVIDTSARC